MAFPSPSDKQAKVLWFSLTVLAIAVFLALLALMLYGVGWMLDRLTPVLLPLAIAGILAFLLNPLVDFFEPKMSAKVSFLFSKIRNPKRVKAILLVLMIGFCIITALTLVTLTTVVPEMLKLAEETKVEYVQQNIRNWATENKGTDWGKLMMLGKLETIDLSALMTAGEQQLTRFSEKGVSEAIALIGLLAGLALVPVYVFYFLLEARTIEMKWSDYLPLKESRFKEEAVFVLSSFNDCLVVFFRGQVLVAFCVGVCLAIGFSIIGLPYAILIGLAAGLLGIIPYFGVIASTIPVLLLSLVYGDQMIVDGAGAPVLALFVCALVLFLEKTVIQPKIIGERVGMHPVAVIISVLMGATLVGGVIGGLLAIPVAMALRTVLFRYVWVRQQMPEKATQMEVL
ncbi:MAG: AI-2E family transporter [Verrucomicrobiia bacterium]